LTGPAKREGLAKLYPVEGDSPLAELWLNDEPWAELRLEGVDVEARGEERVANARVLLRLYGPNEGEWLELELRLAMEQLAEARDWLLEHERAREPVADRSELTHAGEAWSKMSPEVQREWSAKSRKQAADEADRGGRPRLFRRRGRGR
jgi:hypothetical protein